MNSLLLTAESLHEISIVYTKIFSSLGGLIVIFAKILDQSQIIIMSFLKLRKGLFGDLLVIIRNLLLILAPLKGLR
jgi:hypothetical protein